MNDTNVIRFPEVDHYANFKCNDAEMAKFDAVMNDAMESLKKHFPDVDGYYVNDYVLTSEAVMAMIMRAKGISHPLNEIADTVTTSFAEEYCNADSGEKYV